MAGQPRQLGLFESPEEVALELEPALSPETETDDGWVVIHAYTRAQALDEGMLVDVSGTAREAGFVWPVAVTAEVWRLIEQVPDDCSWESPEGRLWDVLNMLRAALKAAQRRGPSGRPDDFLVADSGVETHFRLILHHDETLVNEGLIVFKALAGPGDDGEPVLTILCLGES